MEAEPPGHDRVAFGVGNLDLLQKLERACAPHASAGPFPIGSMHAQGLAELA